MSLITDLPLGAPILAQGPDSSAVARPLDIMRRYGTNIAGCVTPSTEGVFPDRLPRFQRFADAVAATRAVACVSLAAQRNAADAALEAAQAGIRLIVTLTPGVPIHDCLRVRRQISELGATWIGPASAGIARPQARLMLGQVPEVALPPGHVALLTDCGSLGAEAGLRMSAEGIGLSLFVDAGDNPVKGAPMAALLDLTVSDPDTRSLVLLGSANQFAQEDFLSSVQSVNEKIAILAYLPEGYAPASRHAGDDASAPASAPADPAAALAAAGVTLYNSLGALLAALKASA